MRIDHLVTSGTFSLDGGTWDVDNNVWIVGDDEECLLIDAPHDSVEILAAIGDRRLIAVACTHAHDDHVDAALAVAAAKDAPVWLHPAEAPLWQLTHPGRAPDAELADGQRIQVGSIELEVLHTPGHSPGAVCFYVPALHCLFSGDTLFNGGPGATGRSFSSFDTIIESISTKLLVLPAETVVHTGHGEDTAIGAEAPALAEWIARGH
ncbi:glyoxylase-like metal-dependent hydrolase (beta-lactamase superfamily II) [Jatrophihabitans sp. GAS493]|uniref:MBL fold metallo-hydrolase n=1 Tax=Jatrophihabitans sp. GAS493 TaxID=1907575 RepID=UPI000BB7ABBC|nr:glyoxylase-like metal-dependent hydrolase (beta-lactamase superfamily II) [Jatrophihabitans sp. GAS493]